MDDLIQTLKSYGLTEAKAKEHLSKIQSIIMMAVFERITREKNIVVDPNLPGEEKIKVLEQVEPEYAKNVMEEEAKKVIENYLAILNGEAEG